MSDFRDGNPPVTAKARAPKTWDFLETTFVALVAYAVFTLTGIGLGIILMMQVGLEKLTPAQFREFAMQERWLGLATIIACPATLAVLWLAIRMAGRSFTEYLALNWPSRNELLLALAAMAALIAVQFMILPHESSINSPFVVGGAGGLLVVLVGGCLAAPITEELVFRGFMFRGWSESFLGPIGAIILTSALFGIWHTQYDWLARFWIFLVGLILCSLRWRSNSTWLTVVAHSAVNIFLFFLSGPYV